MKQHHTVYHTATAEIVTEMEFMLLQLINAPRTDKQLPTAVDLLCH